MKEPFHGCNDIGRLVRPARHVTGGPHDRRVPGRVLRSDPGEAYTLDLRMFYRWCDERSFGLFDLTRTHIELYARELEDIGRKPATIGRRLSTVTSFHRYASEEGVIEHSPAVHIRRPRLDYERECRRACNGAICCISRLARHGRRTMRSDHDVAGGSLHGLHGPVRQLTGLEHLKNSWRRVPAIGGPVLDCGFVTGDHDRVGIRLDPQNEGLTPNGGQGLAGDLHEVDVAVEPLAVCPHGVVKRTVPPNSLARRSHSA